MGDYLTSSDFTRIPFGFETTSQTFKDVYEVDSGKKCSCVCPSCKTPLIAKKGNVKQWHFAHASRKVFEQTKQECEYSIFVSIRLMARQLIENEIELLLPAYNKLVRHEAMPGFCKTAKITKERRISLNEIKVEALLDNIPVDVHGKVGKYDFIIFFTHPKRDFPRELEDPKNRKVGIITISLDTLPFLFDSAHKEGFSYQSILNDFLTNEVTAKQWRFHPHQKITIENAKKDLAKKYGIKPSLPQHQTQFKTNPVSSTGIGISDEEIDEIVNSINAEKNDSA